MAIRSRLAWAFAFTAISVAVTGAAAPVSSATALTVPHAVTVLRAGDPPSGWVTTTDPASGISVMLPGQPTIDKTTTTVNGESIPVRTYALALSGSKGAVVFMVADGASNRADLDEAMQGFTSATGSDGKVTGSRHFALDGHPALDGRYTVTIDSTPAVGLTRFVSGYDHFVGIATVGAAADENTLTKSHQQVIETLQLPKSPR